MEARLTRHLTAQVNPDGGFYRFPSGPSDPGVTRVAVAALRLVLGEPEACVRSHVEARRNRALRDDDGDDFEGRSPPRRHSSPEPGATPGAARAWNTPFSRAWFSDSWGVDGGRGRVHRRGWFSRALALGAPSCAPAPGSSPPAEPNASRTLDPRRKGSETGSRNAAWPQHIRDTQNECGGWTLNAGHTMLNLMALSTGARAGRTRRWSAPGRHLS